MCAVAALDASPAPKACDRPFRGLLRDGRLVGQRRSASSTQTNLHGAHQRPLEDPVDARPLERLGDERRLVERLELAGAARDLGAVPVGGGQQVVCLARDARADRWRGRSASTSTRTSEPAARCEPSSVARTGRSSTLTSRRFRRGTSRSGRRRPRHGDDERLA